MSSGLRMTGRRGQRWLDGFAVTPLVLCPIDWLVLPALLLALPVLATMLAVPESTHAIALALALPTGALAIASGYRRYRRRWPVVGAGSGLTLLGVGAFAIGMKAMERSVGSASAVLFALAHVGNWRAPSHLASTRPTCPVEDAA